LESAARCACVVRLERDERLPAHVRDLLEILQRSVRLVSRHFADCEAVAGFRHERHELRAIRRVLVEYPNRRYDVRFHAARNMGFYPYAFLPSHAIFLIAPAFKLAAAESARINREIRFDGAERPSRMSNQPPLRIGVNVGFSKNLFTDMPGISFAVYPSSCASLKSQAERRLLNMP
jgi:hypothetical protein